MLGICRQVTPCANVMKLGTVGLLGYVITLTAVGRHRFWCLASSKLGPCHLQDLSGLITTLRSPLPRECMMIT